MLTSDKAICEMNTGELAEEYEYCMKSAESQLLPTLKGSGLAKGSVTR